MVGYDKIRGISGLRIGSKTCDTGHGITTEGLKGNETQLWIDCDSVRSRHWGSSMVSDGRIIGCGKRKR